MTKLTPKQLEFLRLLSSVSRGLDWAVASRTQNAHGTRLSKLGLVERKPSSDYGTLHITDAGRAVLTENIDRVAKRGKQ